MAPEVRIIDGVPWTSHNAEWRKPEHQVSIEECDVEAGRLGLGLTGEQVVERILDYVASQGGEPVRGHVVTKQFDSDVKGAANIGWTKFFKYACNERGLLCYKRPRADGRGSICFSLSEAVVAARARARLGPLPFTAEFEGTFDVPAQDARTAERSHGHVVNQLEADLRALGLSPSNTQLIDLLVELASGCVALFEVKTSADRDSIYTCVGQLMVHRGGQPWRQVAVLPRSIRPDLAAALGTIGIDVLTFSMDGTSVRFDGLAALVERLRRDRE